MFWIGLIVGIIIGGFATYGASRLLMRYIFGSIEQFENGLDILFTANDNRKSYVQVFTDDEVLDTLVFEEQ